MDITLYKIREGKTIAEIFKSCPCTVFEKWGKVVQVVVLHFVNPDLSGCKK